MPDALRLLSGSLYFQAGASDIYQSGAQTKVALDLYLPIRGLAAGFIIAAPVGPVNVLCIRRTIAKGWKSGVVSGFGAALADTLYGAVAGFSITLVIQFLVREEFWIRFVGGIVLMGIGAIYYFHTPGSLAEDGEESAHSELISTLLLTLTNPTTVLSFLAVLATLGLSRGRPLWQTSLLVAGIFAGSMTWWVILAASVNLLRRKFTDRALRWMNRAGGIAIACFGLINLLLSRLHRP